MSNTAILKKLEMLERVFSTSKMFDLVQFIEAYRGSYLFYKDLPQTVKDYMTRLNTVLNQIHLRPGELYPGAWEKLSRREQDVIVEGAKLLREITIKDGENVEPIPIH